MKRITAITKCNGVLAEVLDRKANRIKRAVAQMADCAADKAAESEEKAEDILNSLGSVAGAEQTKELQDKLNAYNQAIQDAKDYRNSSENFKELLAKLDEEVTVEEK